VKNRTVYEEVRELRGSLALKDLADVIGCRRETLSRLKPPRRPTREIERRIDDVFAVLEKARQHRMAAPEDARHLLLARRAELANRSMAEMIRNDRTDAVLALLDTSAAPDLGRDLDGSMAELDRWQPDAGGSGSAGGPPPSPPVDDELLRIIDEVVASAPFYLGPVAVSIAAVSDDTADPDEADALLIELQSGLPFEEADAHLRAFLADHLHLLQPVAERMTVTVAGA